MSIRIIDTFLDVKNCFTPTGFCKQQWNQYINRYLPYAKEIIENDAKGYDFEKEVLPVLNSVYKNYEKAVLLHKVFLTVVSDFEKALPEELQIKTDVIVVFYLGVSDIGYYLGCELVKKACETRGIEEILNLSLYDVEKELYACSKE